MIAANATPWGYAGGLRTKQWLLCHEGARFTPLTEQEALPAVSPTRQTKDPCALYEKLCRVTGERHDPCLIDVFLSVVRFMEGAPAKPWWAYTAERKRATAQHPTARGEP